MSAAPYPTPALNDPDWLDGLRNDWLGRGIERQQTLDPMPVQCLAATLSLPAERWPRQSLPPTWHWVYFPDTTASDQLGEDGIPRSRDLLPPIPADQVMWAGAELQTLQPLAIGVATTRHSRLADIQGKTGARGPMVFVTTEHRYEQAGQLMLVERNHSVFLGPALPGGGAAVAAAAPPASDSSTLSWPVDETVLFRYSALTFNAHRIHYDLRYTTKVAGYPGLVVHGPLQALLIAETFRARHPQHLVRQLDFRAKSPLYCHGQVRVDGTAGPQGGSLFSRTTDGQVAMEGRFSG